MSIKKPAVPARRKSAAPTGVAATIAERRNQHGDPNHNFHTSQRLKRVVRTAVAYDALTDVQKEAVDNVLQKVARIVAGNPNHKDHWHDIQGYAKIAEDRVQEG